VSPASLRVNAWRRAFTLMESALATIIIGIGVLAMMGLFEACTRQNRHAASATTAMMYNPNRPLPDGINMAIDLTADPSTYVEGKLVLAK
jgi:hypothetical protein